LAVERLKDNLVDRSVGVCHPIAQLTLDLVIANIVCVDFDDSAMLGCVVHALPLHPLFHHVAARGRCAAGEVHHMAAISSPAGTSAAITRPTHPVRRQ
jgi:hypothetical protein